MYQLLKQIAKVGIVTEPAPHPDEALRALEQRLGELILKHFGRSLAIRHVDAGSCNGCELEIHAMNGPHYNLERLGIRFVASPRHADMLLVTGPVSRNMEVALKRTWEATPDPKLVVAIGDCGCTGGIFGESYASCGRVSNVIPVDVAVPGCPPAPVAIMQGILAAIRVLGLAGGIGVLRLEPWGRYLLELFCWALIVLAPLSAASRLYALQRPQPDSKPVNWLGAIAGVTLILIPILTICGATIATLRSPETLKAFSAN